MKKFILTIFILCLITTSNQAQKQSKPVKIVKNDNGVVVSIKDTKDATIYIDGKKYDNEILKIIDVNKIESIQILKGEEAINAYGVDKVVLLTTKKENKTIEDKTGDKKGMVKITTRDLNMDGDDETKYPVFIIDGKTSDQHMLKELNPDDIHSISVVKGEKAIKKYNAPNGAVIVTTKKKKKSKK
jgi:hypothetical protein